MYIPATFPTLEAVPTMVPPYTHTHTHTHTSNDVCLCLNFKTGFKMLMFVPPRHAHGDLTSLAASRESSLLFRLERGAGVALQARQEKKALI